MAALSEATAAIALDTLASDPSALFTSLFHSANIAPYKCNSDATQRRSFGPSGDHYPQMSPEISPFDKENMLSLPELQQMSLCELGKVHDYLSHWPMSTSFGNLNSTGQATAESASTLMLILSLTGPSFNEKDTIVSFPSETLDKLCVEAGKGKPTNLLQASYMKCNIIAKDSLIPLQHSNEGSTITTLLSGSMIWLIWPPTAHNHRILQAAYESFRITTSKGMLETCQTLEGGIALTQIEGEGLRIPPFCPMMGLSPLTTTVLATYSTITADNIISMLPKAALLQAWFTTEINGPRKQTEFNAQLLKWLDVLLNGALDEDTGERDRSVHFSLVDNGRLLHLLNIWDSVKDGLARLLGPADAEVLAEIWRDFLVESRGRECRICGTVVRNKLRLMHAHFLEQHWPARRREVRSNSSDETDLAEGG